VVGMEKEVLVILMVAFGLFAIVMFILFFIYLKRYYNNKHLDEDYQKDIDKELSEEASNNDEVVVEPIISPLAPKEEVIEPKVNVVVDKPVVQEEGQDLEFVPIKKK
jgi:flagellar basal body-associated protein FliL